jgi:hypothetical protein
MRLHGLTHVSTIDFVMNFQLASPSFQREDSPALPNWQCLLPDQADGVTWN